MSETIFILMNFLLIFAGGTLFGVIISFEHTKREVFKMILDYEHEKMVEELEKSGFKCNNLGE